MQRQYDGRVIVHNQDAQREMVAFPFQRYILFMMVLFCLGCVLCLIMVLRGCFLHIAFLVPD